MIKPILLFIVGLVCLIKGGDWFVDGASAMARKFHLPELLIGATVVSIGTTLPEVMVSTMSALSGHGEIAYGNAIGSVICNTALIAAITIAVKPGPADPKTLRIPVAFFYIAALYCGGHLLCGRVCDGKIYQNDGTDHAGCLCGLYGRQCAFNEERCSGGTK